MSIKDQTSQSGGGTEKLVNLTDVREEHIDFQILRGLQRIETRLEALEARMAGSGGSTRAVRTEKPNIRNLLLAMLMKGWVSETEAMEKTGWTTIGVRSLVTKLRTNGFSVETEERDGVPHYRIAK